MSLRTIPIPQSAQINPDSLKMAINAFLKIIPIPHIQIEGDFVTFLDNHSDLNRLESQIWSVVSKLEIDPRATWSYFGKSGYFLAFPEDENRRIEDFYINHAKVYESNYKNHSQSFQISSPKEGRIYFDKLGGFHLMIRNKKIIPIKRFAAHESFSPDIGRNFWKWKDLNEVEYKNYWTDENYYLEVAYQKWTSNKKLRVRLHSSRGLCYEINFKKMIQKNTLTNFERNIKRININ